MKLSRSLVIQHNFSGIIVRLHHRFVYISTLFNGEWLWNITNVVLIRMPSLSKPLLNDILLGVTSQPQSSVTYTTAAASLCCNTINDTQAEWPPFYRLYFQMHFHVWHLLYSDLNFKIFDYIAIWPQHRTNEGPEKWRVYKNKWNKYGWVSARKTWF